MINCKKHSLLNRQVYADLMVIQSSNPNIKEDVPKKKYIHMLNISQKICT
jgi:hypothetical protein